MGVQKDPILQSLITAVILAFLTALGVKIKREFRRIKRFLKRAWQMARGNGMTLDEHNAAIIDLKSYIDAKTYGIQPDSNGGASLADLIRTVNVMADKQEEIRDMVFENLGVQKAHSADLHAHQ